MEDGLFEAIAGWSADQMTGDELHAILESSGASIAGHQRDFAFVVRGLPPTQ